MTRINSGGQSGQINELIKLKGHDIRSYINLLELFLTVKQIDKVYEVSTLLALQAADTQ